MKVCFAAIFQDQELLKCFLNVLLIYSVEITATYLAMHTSNFSNLSNPVSWDCKIHWLHLGRRVRLPTSVMDMILNNLLVKLEYCWSFGQYRVPLYCSSLPGPLQPRMVDFEMVLSMGQIELFDIYTEFKQVTYAKLNC